jgi:hypothetical protein
MLKSSQSQKIQDSHIPNLEGGNYDLFEGAILSHGKTWENHRNPVRITGKAAKI